MARAAVIGLDLGGTKLAGAIFINDGKLLHRVVLPLAARQGRAVGRMIGQTITDLLAVARAKRLEITAIGVSVPGISHSRTGTIWAPNIPGWRNYPLRREIESVVRVYHASRLTSRPLRIPVAIDSDRACYILGEAWRGRARGCRDAIFLAVGTGIGAGILTGGTILRGSRDIAGAIGWLALDRPFRPEYVGCGCFEHHASGQGLAKVARKLLARTARRKIARGSNRAAFADQVHPTARDVFSACDRGDAVAREVLRRAIEFWGMAVANLVSLFNPEKIIFGGGVFGPGTRFLDDIRAEAKKWAQPISMGQVKIQAAKLGSDAGLYGAGFLAIEAARQPRRGGKKL